MSSSSKSSFTGMRAVPRVPREELQSLGNARSEVQRKTRARLSSPRGTWQRTRVGPASPVRDRIRPIPWWLDNGESREVGTPSLGTDPGERSSCAREVRGGYSQCPVNRRSSESFDPAQLVREEVQRRSSPWRFQAYFEDTIWQVNEPPNRLSVSTPDRERRLNIEKAYGDRIRDAARAVLKLEIELTIDEIQVARPSRTDSTPGPARVASPPSSPSKPSSRDRRAAWLMPWPCPSRRSPEMPTIPLHCGPPGVGKTHLLQAICCRLREKTSLEPLLLGRRSSSIDSTAAASTKNLDDFRGRIREARAPRHR